MKFGIIFGKKNIFNHIKKYTSANDSGFSQYIDFHIHII